MLIINKKCEEVKEENTYESRNSCKVVICSGDYHIMWHETLTKTMQAYNANRDVRNLQSPKYTKRHYVLFYENQRKKQMHSVHSVY